MTADKIHSIIMHKIHDAYPNYRHMHILEDKAEKYIIKAKELYVPDYNKDLTPPLVVFTWIYVNRQLIKVARRLKYDTKSSRDVYRARK